MMFNYSKMRKANNSLTIKARIKKINLDASFIAYRNQLFTSIKPFLFPVLVNYIKQFYTIYFFTIGILFNKVEIVKDTTNTRIIIKSTPTIGLKDNVFNPK